MGRHSVQWKAKLDLNNIQTEFIGFYVDDGRVVLCGLRWGRDGSRADYGSVLTGR